jgi:hypothetical protein
MAIDRQAPMLGATKNAVGDRPAFQVSHICL